MSKISFLDALKKKISKLSNPILNQRFRWLSVSVSLLVLSSVTVVAFQNCGAQNSNGLQLGSLKVATPTPRRRSGGEPTPDPSASPVYTPSPGASPSPGSSPTPSPSPGHSPTPTPSPGRSPSPSPSPSASPGNKPYPTAADCDHDPCFSAVAVYRKLDGKSYDATQFRPMPVDNMFHSGGSLNIPVVKAVGKYLEDGDATWFVDYFTYQEPGQVVGLQHNEVLSPIYEGITVASVETALNIALNKTNKTAKDNLLIQKASRWLKATWALHALMAMPIVINTVKMHLWNGVQTRPNSNPNLIGYVSGHAGPRSASEGGAGNFMYQLLGLAVGQANVPMGGRVWGGMGGAFYLAAGVTIDSQGYARQPNPIAANRMGLTDTERNRLKAFMDNPTEANLGPILAMIGDYRPSPHCSYTILRTTSGITTWLGTSSAPGEICNRNKGPYFAGSLTNSGIAEYLHLNVKKDPAESGYAYRDGNRICAAVQLASGPKTDCQDILPGSILYEFSWTSTRGLVREH